MRVVIGWILVLGCSPTRLPERPAPTHSPASHRPLETVTGTINGVAYSIEVPAGAKKTSAMINDRWRAAGDPTVNILIDLAHSITFEEQLGKRREPIVHSERRADDVWAFSFEHAPAFDGAMGEASVFARVGALFCHGHVRATNPREDVKLALPMLERMCLSLSVK